MSRVGTRMIYCTTLLMVFSIAYPILRGMLGYTNEQPLHY